MPYFTIFLIAVFAAFFYRATEIENAPALLWCGLSIAISVAVLYFLHLGWLGIILGQLGLFIGITVLRMARKP